MDRILYHYTDFIALDGILRGKELRLNNVLNMNDAEEMKLFLKCIFEAVYGRLINAGEKEKALKVQELVNEQYKKRFEYSAYAACFHPSGTMLPSGSGMQTGARVSVWPCAERSWKK